MRVGEIMMFKWSIRSSVLYR